MKDPRPDRFQTRPTLDTGPGRPPGGAERDRRDTAEAVPDFLFQANDCSTAHVDGAFANHEKSSRSPAENSIPNSQPSFGYYTFSISYAVARLTRCSSSHIVLMPTERSIG